VQFFNNGKSLQAAFVCVALTGILLFGNAHAWATEVTIAAGKEGIPAGPICTASDKPLDANRAYTLTANGRSIPAQTDADGRLLWWTDALQPEQSVRYDLQPADAQARVKLSRQDEQIEVTIDGKLFTSLHFKKSEPKVYLYPVVGPTGVGVTRDFPMRDNPVEKDNKRQDHPHQRSFWTAWGDVRIGDFKEKGYDFWAERSGGPRQVLTRVARIQSGPVFGEVEAEIEWRNPEGQRLLTEHRTYRFFAGDADQRVIDQKNVFKCNDMDVMFADTKEGGIFSIRLAVTMDELGTKTPSDVRGRMFNSKGGSGAKEVWGKPAEWCDYVGPLEGRTVGVAVFDHPENLHHPTTWHIRDYGLFTANPFGLRDFTGDKDKDGSQVWKKGESGEFKYRAVLHKGDTKTARIADQWKVYDSPPNISVK
jgi:hypothetical protein